MERPDRHASFTLLVDEVYEPLQRYVRRRCPADDVDDVLNATLLVLWRRVEEVPADRPLPWCYGVARRTLANERRAGDRRHRLHLRVAGAAGTSGAYRWSDEADGHLQAALDRLPEPDQELVRLWAWEQLEPREIAEVLGATPNAVALRLSRLRRRLRADIERQDAVAAGHKRTDDQWEPDR